VILIGNSIGSQVAVMAAAELKAKCAGVFLINCAGGMNAKGARAAAVCPTAAPMNLPPDDGVHNA
jgi:pimeloyl-ACP methyl ester carboxylesterase